MSARKPVLGYPSRTAAVLALSRQGHGDRHIAKAIGITTMAVSALRCSARRQALKPLPNAAPTRDVPFPTVILDRLAPEAADRGISVDELIRRVVETVAHDNLYEAVLDEEAGR